MFAQRFNNSFEGATPATLNSSESADISKCTRSGEHTQEKLSLRRIAEETFVFWWNYFIHFF